MMINMGKLHRLRSISNQITKMVKEVNKITRVPKASGAPVQKQLTDAESRKLKIKEEAAIKRNAQKAKRERRVKESAEQQGRDRVEMISNPPPAHEIFPELSDPFPSMPDICFVERERNVVRAAVAVKRPYPIIEAPSAKRVKVEVEEKKEAQATNINTKEIRALKRPSPTIEATPSKRVKVEANEEKKATDGVRVRREDEMAVAEAPVTTVVRKIGLLVERDMALDRNDVIESKRLNRELTDLDELRRIEDELRKRPLPNISGIQISSSLTSERNRKLTEGKRIQETTITMEKMRTSGEQISKYDPYNRRSVRPNKTEMGKRIIEVKVTAVETAEMEAQDPVGLEAEIIKEEATIPLILHALGLMRVPVPVVLAAEIVEEEATISRVIDAVPLHEFIPEKSDRGMDVPLVSDVPLSGTLSDLFSMYGVTIDESWRDFDIIELGFE